MASLTRPDRRTLCIIALISLLGFAGRLYFHYNSSGGTLSASTYRDERHYYIGGANLFHEQGWSYFLTSRSLHNGPGNILWIAGLGRSLALVKICNLLLLALVGVMAWHIGSRLFGNRAGLFSLIFCTLHLPFLWFGPTGLSEPPFVFLVFLSFWLFFIAGERRNYFFASGLALGFAALVRPTVQLLPIFLLILLFGVKLGIPSAPALQKLSVRKFLFVFLGFLVLVGPWIVKNAMYLEKTGIANGVGAVLYVGNDLRKDGDEPIYSRMHFDTMDVTYPQGHLETKADRKLIEATVERAKRFPMDTALLLLEKPFRYLFGTRDHYFHPYRDYRRFLHHYSLWDSLPKTGELLLTPLVVFSGVIGLLTLCMPGGMRLFAVGTVLYFVLIHALTFPIPRLALPIFPILTVFAGGLFGTSGLLKRKALALAGSAFIVLWIAISARGISPSIVTERVPDYYTEVSELSIQDAQLHHLEQTSTGELKAIGKDPHVIFSEEIFDGLRNQVLFFELTAIPRKASQREQRRGQVFWRRSIDKQFAEKRSSDFFFQLDGEKHLYRVSPSLVPEWNGQIVQIRLDLIDGGRGIRYRLGPVFVKK